MIIDLNTFTPSSPLYFLVLEGVNGAGKTTLQRTIASFLEGEGRSVVTTREPGGTEVGTTLRKLIFEKVQGSISSTCELLLFGADRAFHVDTLIRPSIAEKKVVISDRYFYSTIAFQGYGRSLDLETVYSINAIAIRNTLPDLTILLDLDPAKGLKRNASDHSEECDTFEKEEIAFHNRIREGFLKIAEERDEPFLVIDASLPQDEVAWLALQAIQRFTGKEDEK